MTPHFIGGPQRALTRFGEVPQYREGLYAVGRDAYAWMVPNGSWGETNLGLVVCGRESVLIDTCWDLHFTREVLTAAQDVLRRAPIEYVINTHADGDHCWGNQLFADKPIIATEACQQQFLLHHPSEFHMLSTVGKRLANLPIASLAALGHYAHHMFGPYDFRDLELTVPNRSFRREHVLRAGGTELVLMETGPGHTGGDCMVWLPDQRVVYTADILFVGVTPVAWVGPVDTLITSLKRVLALEPSVIVPGHGPLATAADVQRVIDYWEFVQGELHTRFRAGMPSHVAARDVILGRSFAESPFAGWDSPERLVSSAETLYRGWGVRSFPSLGPRIAKLRGLGTMRRQAQLALELPNATPRIMHRMTSEAALVATGGSRRAP